MRKITKEAVNAFMNGTNYNNSNTKVEVNEQWTVMTLFGNAIAYHGKDGRIQISNRGWFSNTTKERLNAIPNVNIVQRRGVWYLNGNEWDGQLIDIN